jgi:hypothetical protein
MRVLFPIRGLFTGVIATTENFAPDKSPRRIEPGIPTSHTFLFVSKQMEHMVRVFIFIRIHIKIVAEGNIIKLIPRACSWR